MENDIKIRERTLAWVARDMGLADLAFCRDGKDFWHRRDNLAARTSHEQFDGLLRASLSTLWPGATFSDQTAKALTAILHQRYLTVNTLGNVPGA